MTGADNELRCNNLKCRVLVAQQGRAVVTTCSHIFCVPCANDLFSRSEACSACDHTLSEPSDVVESYLNPASEYKSTVLSGLHPSVIMEIATRAMSFWTYQTGQESAFQAMIRQNMQAKADKQEQMLTTANNRAHLAEKKAALAQQDLEQEQKRSNDLQMRLKEAKRENGKMRATSDKMKTRALLTAAAQQTQMPDSRSVGSSDFVPPRAPAHYAPPAAHQPPAPFVPTPVRQQTAANPRDILSRQNLKRLSQAHAQTGQGGINRIEMTPRGVIPGGPRQALAPVQINAYDHKIGAQTSLQMPIHTRPPSKLAQRRTVGPAEYGATF